MKPDLNRIEITPHQPPGQTSLAIRETATLRVLRDEGRTYVTLLLVQGPEAPVVTDTRRPPKPLRPTLIHNGKRLLELENMITLRPQEPSDITPLVELSNRAWTDVEEAVDALLGSPLDRLATPSWSAHHEAVVTEACESLDTSVIVAEDSSGATVGFVAYLVHPESSGMSAYGEITVIAVDPVTRGQGVGSRLLDHAVRELRDAGAPVIMVQTGGDDGHGPARTLYESAGFARLPIAQYWLPG